MKNMLKVLPLSFPFNHKKAFWEECVQDENRIEPVYHRDGYYYDRGTKKTWLEINGEAWVYYTPEAFKFDLDHSEGNNWMEDHVFKALRVVLRNGLGDKRLRELYYVAENRRQLRTTRRDAALCGLQSRKRLTKFIKTRRNCTKETDVQNVTIDEAIEFLQYARCVVGGDKCLILCLQDSELLDVNVNELVLINDGESQYVEVLAAHPDLVSE